MKNFLAAGLLRRPLAGQATPKRIIGFRVVVGVPVMSLPRTLGELRQSPFSEQRLRSRRVKDELRDNLITRLRATGSVFPGIVGYDDWYLQGGLPNVRIFPPPHER